MKNFVQITVNDVGTDCMDVATQAVIDPMPPFEIGRALAALVGVAEKVRDDFRQQLVGAGRADLVEQFDLGVRDAAELEVQNHSGTARIDAIPPQQQQ